MLNFQAARITHRHGDQWVELTPVATHSADPDAPERQLLRRTQIFRCKACDEEVQVEPGEGSSS